MISKAVPAVVAEEIAGDGGLAVVQQDLEAERLDVEVAGGL